jgi:hypothetical protein
MRACGMERLGIVLGCSGPGERGHRRGDDELQGHVNDFLPCQFSPLKSEGRCLFSHLRLAVLITASGLQREQPLVDRIEGKGSRQNRSVTSG